MIPRGNRCHAGNPNPPLVAHGRRAIGNCVLARSEYRKSGAPGAIRTPAPSSRRQVEELLVQRMAVDIAKLVHKHERVEFGENLGTR